MKIASFAALSGLLALVLGGVLPVSDAGAQLFGRSSQPVEAQAAPVAGPGPDFSELADRLLPTVVNVSTTQTIKDAPEAAMPEFPPGSPFEDFFKDFYERHKNSPQTPLRPTSLGSGFVIDAREGYVVTNNHVIKDADEIKVILHDDTSLPAELIGTDEKTDIAVLKIKTEKPLTAISWGDSDVARVGSWTLVIGNPFGLGGTVTAGIISARQRDINAGPYDDFIQTDASINRGNSGGPMFNMKGEVIGVSTAIFSPSGGSVGIGFAVPSNLARPVVEQLIRYGKTKRGWLGVRIQAVTEDIADNLGLKSADGALISNVTEDGPAAKAGIMAGDIILSFNGHPVRQMRQLPRLVAETEVGKKAAVTLLRRGTTKEVEVTLGQLEKAEEEGLIETADAGKEGDKAGAAATPVPDLGIKVGALTPELKNRFNLKEGVKGVAVLDLDNTGPAAEKGMMPGDVIVEIDQEQVFTPADVAARVTAARKAGRASVLMFVARQGDMRFVAVKFSDDRKKVSPRKSMKDEEGDLEEKNDQE